MALLLIPATFVVSAAQEAGNLDVLIRTSSNEAAIRNAIETAGGKITYEYSNLDVLAAEVPVSNLGDIQTIAGVTSVAKDASVSSPEDFHPFGRDSDAAAAAGFPVDAGVTADTVDPLENIPTTKIKHIGNARKVTEFANEYPNAYLINHPENNVQALHAMDFTGEDVVVAVIDSGLRPKFDQLRRNAVVGCDDILAPPASEASEESDKSDKSGKSGKSNKSNKGLCEDDSNWGHGTFVAGLIAGNAIASFDPESLFASSVGFFFNAPAPDAIIPTRWGPGVAMVGSAPNAKIYALRIFPDEGVPATTSDVLAAIDRVLELKIQEGLNIGVVNMSLGKETLNAGNSILDYAVQVLLDADIVPVVSAGNAGPSSATIASPGTAVESLSVGAASVAHQERIAVDMFFGGLGAGAFGFRTFPFPQTAWFTLSRSPTPAVRAILTCWRSALACSPRACQTVALIVRTKW